MANTKKAKEAKPVRQAKSDRPAWLVRVIKERDDLQKRLSKLCAFMDTRFEECKFLELPPADRILLERQRKIMMEYRDVLDVRIALNGGEK